MTENVERLKELLFESENQTLSELDRRVEDALDRLITLEKLRKADNIQRHESRQLLGQLLDTVGTRETFIHNVDSIITDVLHKAGTQNRDDIMLSLAPLVVKTIDSELRNDRNKLASALHPITGLMVKLYFVNAARRLIGKLDRLLECNFLMLQIRSVISGKSVAELSVTESQHLQVEEIFLMQRNREMLLAYWPGDRPEIDISDIVSVIYNFATDKFQDNDSKLVKFEYDHSTFFVRASSFYIIAARCSGVAPAGTDGIVNHEFLSLLEKVNLRNGYAMAFANPGVHTHELAPFAAGVKAKTAAIYAENVCAGLPFRPLRALLLMLLVAISSGLTWWGYITLERKQIEKTAQEITARIARLQGYPINLDIGYRGQDIRISGLAPDIPVVNRLRDELATALPHAKIAIDLSILPNFENITQKQLLSGLKSQIAVIEAEAKRRSLRQVLERARERILQAKLELRRIRSKLQSTLQHKALAAIEEAIERIEGGVDTYIAIVKATSHDLISLQNLNTPLRGLSEMINAAIVQITSLSDETVQSDASNSMVDIGNVTVASEYLEVQSQRLMNTVLIISHTLSIKPLLQTAP